MIGLEDFLLCLFAHISFRASTSDLLSYSPHRAGVKIDTGGPGGAGASAGGGNR